MSYIALSHERRKISVPYKLPGIFSFPVPDVFDPEKDQIPDIDKQNFAGAMLARFLPKMTKEYLRDFHTTLGNSTNKINQFVKLIVDKRLTTKEDLKEAATSVFGNFGKNSEMSEGVKDAIFYSVNLVEKLYFAKSLKQEKPDARIDRVHAIISEQSEQFGIGFLNRVLNRPLNKTSNINPPHEYQIGSKKLKALSKGLNKHLKYKEMNLESTLSRSDIILPKKLKKELDQFEGHQKIAAVGEINRQIKKYLSADIPLIDGKSEFPEWNEIVDWSEISKTAKTCPGWRNALMNMPNDIAWVIHLAEDPNSLDLLDFDSKFKNLPPFWNAISPYKGFQKGSYERICEEFKIEPWFHGSSSDYDYASHLKLSAFNLSNLFERNVLGAIQFVRDWKNRNRDEFDFHVPESSSDDKNELTSNDLHTAAINLHLPPSGSWNKKEWSSLIMRHPEVAKFSSGFDQIEKHMGRVPKSLNETREAVGIIGYGDVPEKYTEIAKECARMEVESYTFKEMLEYLPDQKKEVWLPNIVLETEEYNVKLLPPGDFKALVAGEYSSCCQSVGSAGGSCAVHSYKQPASGVYWIENKNGTFLAQTWSWLNKNLDTICFDSIESPHEDKNNIEIVAKAISHLSAELSQKEGFNVVVGKTSYGMTEDVTKVLNLNTKNGHMEQPKMHTNCGYTDSRSGVYLIENGVKQNLKLKVENVDPLLAIENGKNLPEENILPIPEIQPQFARHFRNMMEMDDDICF